MWVRKNNMEKLNNQKDITPCSGIIHSDIFFYTIS